MKQLTPAQPIWKSLRRMALGIFAVALLIPTAAAHAAPSLAVASPTAGATFGDVAIFVLDTSTLGTPVVGQAALAVDLLAGSTKVSTTHYLYSRCLTVTFCYWDPAYSTLRYIVTNLPAGPYSMRLRATLNGVTLMSTPLALTKTTPAAPSSPATTPTPSTSATAPKITVAGIVNGQTVAAPLAIKVSITDTSLVTLDRLIDGTKVGASVLVNPLNKNPMTWDLGRCALTSGTHKLQVRGTNAAGLIGFSPVITFTFQRSTCANSTMTMTTAPWGVDIEAYSYQRKTAFTITNAGKIASVTATTSAGGITTTTAGLGSTKVTGTLNWKIPYSQNRPRPNGTVTFKVTSVDGIVNQFTYSS